MLGTHPAAANRRHDPLVLGSWRFGVNVYDGNTGRLVGPLRIVGGGSPFGLAADTAGSVYVQTFDRISAYRPRVGLAPTTSWRWDAKAGQLVGVAAGRLVLANTTEALLLSAQGVTLAHARVDGNVMAAAVDAPRHRVAINSSDGATSVYEVGPRSLRRLWTSREQPTTDIRFTASGTLVAVLAENSPNACEVRELSGDSGRPLDHRRRTGSRCTTAALAVPARCRIAPAEVVSDVVEDARGGVYVATSDAFIAIDRSGVHRHAVTPGFQSLAVVDP